jgi:hypothetical protein
MAIKTKIPTNIFFWGEGASQMCRTDKGIRQMNLDPSIRRYIPISAMISWIYHVCSVKYRAGFWAGFWAGGRKIVLVIA